MGRIIVTGGNGFVGRRLIEKLLSSKRYSLIMISNKSDVMDRSVQKKWSQELPLTSYIADIRDKSTILEIFSDERPDACIHLAAKINVVDSIKNPDETFDVNVGGTLNVLEACYKSNIENFIFTSSAAVYGEPVRLPITEDQALHPLSPYGVSKMRAEQHVASYIEKNKIQNAVSLRIFNIYGQGQQGQSDVITRFLERISKGLPPIIHGDGQQTRDFISIDDVVHGISLLLRLMEKSQNNNERIPTLPAALNMGTGIPTNINELAQKMIKIFGLDLKPTYSIAKEDNGAEIKQSYADMKKSKEALKFVPRKGIDVGLKEIISAVF